ncbi:aldose 1-epimerase family protein [Dinghuibacter silviterrae]|uniref:Galactose mutarotase-like enzyme n=1 Tax=Dinghuibacter silviterrae TaxID=1539049 RepID=A0A4V3GLL3_9BACT|nr:aldose 1-epimerase family protein [Dinghuibacter silviterrae]TDX00013.1 galactose mutarotase-like enzyme [Dinghuibacter silviterrae]
MIELHNDLLQVAIDPKGAELQMLCRKDNGLNYLWKGDPAFWGKFSPVLFPIVGTLRDNHYRYQGKTYTLPRHGFARDKTFVVSHLGPSEAEFSLSDDESTRSVFPFPFILRLHYRLDGAVMELRYEVHNPGDGPLFFSVGGHPAFAVPLVAGTEYEDYTLTFSQPETASRRVLADGLLSKTATPFLQDERLVHLSHALFTQDAIVLNGLVSDTVTLGSSKTPHGLTFRIRDWPDLGIWAAPDAPFVCIEPWQGHADEVDTDQELTHKKGIVALAAGATWSRAWTVELH